MNARIRPRSISLFNSKDRKSVSIFEDSGPHAEFERQQIAELATGQRQYRKRVSGRASRRRLTTCLELESLETRLCLSGFSLVPALGSPFPVPAVAVATGDFNHDGNMDLATTNQAIPLPPGGIGTVRVLLGNGLGGFSLGALFPVAPVGTTSPLALAVEDFNRDGNPDLATANTDTNTVSVLLGDGLGGFTPAVTFPVGSQPSSIVARDFNGDHVPDLATANKSSDNVSVLMGDGLGGFAPAVGSPFAINIPAPPPPPPLPPPPPVIFAPASLAIGDFNGDGHADLATANSASGNVSVLLGDGLGGFALNSVIPVLGSSPIFLAVANANSDTHVDLVAAYTSGGVSALLGDGSGGFTPLGAMPTFGFPVSLAVADFNGDGHVDVVTTASGTNAVGVHLGDGTGAFPLSSTFPAAPAGEIPRSVAVADFNGDGRPDVATANLSSVSVLLNVPPPPNLPPVANDDGPLNVLSGQPLPLASPLVLGNDSDIDGFIDPNSISITQPPSHGVIGPDPLFFGQLTYRSDSTYTGSDSFRYTVRDNAGAVSNPATVTLIIIGNQPPVANDDFAQTVENAPVGFCVACNDVDPDGGVDFFSVVITQPPSYGTLATFPNVPAGAVIYSPNPGYFGLDSFAYTVRDNLGAVSNEAHVTLDIHENLPPVAVDDSLTFQENTAPFLFLAGNDSDPDGSLDFTSIVITQFPSHGTVALPPAIPLPPGFVLYTPDIGYAGLDSFAYTIRDNSGAVSNVAHVSLTIVRNQPPVAGDDSAATLINQQVFFDVLSNDADPDGGIDVSSFTLKRAPSHGTVTPVPFSPFVMYTPDLDYLGSDTFTYTVRDFSGAESNVAIVSIDVQLARLREFGQLAVFGTSKRDILRIDREGNMLVVHALLGMPPERMVGSARVDGRSADPSNPKEKRLEFPAAGVQSIFIAAGAGDDQVTVARTITLPAFIDGGEGDDWLKTGSGDDTVFDFSGSNRIETGDGDDHIFAFGLAATNEIDAGAGNDVIYAGNGNDSINAGSGNDIVRAGGGDDSVDGGSGNDILLGQEGNDIISGGDGRDILIGGTGADQLVGNAGDDLLIGGTTTYDFDDLALLSILAEWASAKSYSDRVASISAGIGGPLGFRLNGDLGPSQTIFDDNDVDTLTGNQGQDWFFANRVADGSGPLDKISDKAANEIWTDIDALLIPGGP